MASMERMGVEYLDLYLLHQAMGNYFEAYRAMEDAYEEGKLKAIGVSNFFPHSSILREEEKRGAGAVRRKNEEEISIFLFFPLFFVGSPVL